MVVFANYLIVGLVISLKLVTYSDAKTNYRLEVESFERYRDPSHLVKFDRLRVLKYNSTVNVMDWSFNLTKDLPLDTMVYFTVYQLMNSNKFSMIPVPLIPCQICGAIDPPNFLYKQLLPKSNFPTKCPIRKGQYWLRDFYLSYDGFPPELPGERWRLVTILTSNKRTLAKWSALVYINRNI